MVKRGLSCLLAVVMVLAMAGCATTSQPAASPESVPEAIEGSGTITEFSSSQEPESENPDGNAEGGEPASGSDSGSSSGSSAGGSSSQAPSSSSVPPSSSSAPPSSSSSVAPSSSVPPSSSSSSSSTGSSNSGPTNEVRAVWLSYLDLGPMITNRTEKQFTTSIRSAFAKLYELGMNTVYVQVRPFGDALYPSNYFPQSYLFTGQEGEVGEAPFDALEIMVTEAHRLGMKVEAWLNPYRIRATGTLGNKPIHESNPANDFMDSGSDAVVQYEKGLFYNPGSAEARELIVAGVREIVDNYAVDGIHFDDYFYPPGATAAFDRNTYNNSGTGKSLANWRREQVNILVKQVYNAVGKSRVFGISPAGNNSNNYNLLYCDVATWLSTPGYVDYICPQVYFGFNNSTCPYEATVKQFNNMISASGVKIYVGLATYKVGDSAQGSEWTGNPTMMKRQVEFARTVSNYGGFALYRYDFVVGTGNQLKKEMENLHSIL